MGVKANSGYLDVRISACATRQGNRNNNENTISTAKFERTVLESADGRLGAVIILVGDPFPCPVLSGDRPSRELADPR